MSTLQPSGVIFDFDGVVVDSLSVHLSAWQLSYQQLYQEPIVDTQGLAGRSTNAIAEILSKRAGKPETLDDLANLKRELLKQNRFSIQLLPGVSDALHWLKSSALPYGIASNAPRSFIENTLAKLQIDIPHIFGSDDVANPKPAPDVFLKCAKSLKISVTKHCEILVFEDSPHGLTAAVKAGMFPVGVLTQNKAQEMLAAGALATCENVGEALRKGWFRSLPPKSQSI